MNTFLQTSRPLSRRVKAGGEEKRRGKEGIFNLDVSL
jgi:hypothetical protein